MAKKDIERFLKTAGANTAERSTARYTELRGRRKNEVDLWHHWNDHGRQPEHLEPLLKSIDPMVRSEASRRLQGLGGSMPRAALVQELRNSAVKSIEKWKPSAAAQLSTWITGNFRSVTDVVSSMRNPKYNPRPLVDRYGTFQNAVHEFEEEHGRPPSAVELHAKLPEWKPAMIRRMQKSFGQEVFSDMGSELDNDVNRPDAMQKIRSAASLLSSQMTEEQRRFIELHYPTTGQQMSVSAIAKHLKMPDHKVYRIKKLVEAKLAPLVRSE